MRDGESVDVLLEPSCGYGAFFNTEFGTENTRYIGADIDSDAITVAKENFPKNEFFLENVLFNVGRSKYNIGSSEKVVIVETHLIMTRPRM